MKEVWVMRDTTWRAKNIRTGELCPHHHHTKESATRCAVRTYGQNVARAVQWTTDDQSLIARRIRADRRRYRRALHIAKQMNKEDLI